MSIFYCYWLPLLVSIVCDIIISYLSGAKTIGELFSIMSILSFIPLMNLYSSLCGIITIFVIVITYISEIEIRR
jgi:hypothetical protein